MSPHPSSPASGGFTYIGVLILIAIIGLASSATLYVGKIQQRRAAEEELLNIGMEFRSALIAYANGTPFGLARRPSSLMDLLKDPRYPSARRYLRKLYIDPMTGKPQWGVVRTIDGNGIIAVYSLSDAKPIKIGNFPQALAEFENKTSYRDWKFGAPEQMGLNPVEAVAPDAVPAPLLTPTNMAN